MCHLTPQSPSARTLFGSHAECSCGLHPQRAAVTSVPNYRVRHHSIKIIVHPILIHHASTCTDQHFCSTYCAVVTALLSSENLSCNGGQTVLSCNEVEESHEEKVRSASRISRTPRAWTMDMDPCGCVRPRGAPENPTQPQHIHTRYPTVPTAYYTTNTPIPTRTCTRACRERLLASRASPLLTRAVRCEALAQLGDA